MEYFQHGDDTINRRREIYLHEPRGENAGTGYRQTDLKALKSMALFAAVLALAGKSFTKNNNKDT